MHAVTAKHLQTLVSLNLQTLFIALKNLGNAQHHRLMNTQLAEGRGKHQSWWDLFKLNITC